MPSFPSAKPRAAALVMLMLPAAFVLVQAAYFYHLNKTSLGLGMPIDDAYIFKRYAENIAAGAGFSFNPHETSFGGTSLIWPIIMAALVKSLPFLDYVTMVFWLGAALLAAAAAGAAALVRSKTRSALAGLCAGVMIAASPLMFMNAVSGMETPLTTALLVAFAALVLLDQPRPAAAGLAAGLLTINRPEGVYFPAGAAIAWLVLVPFRDKRLAAGLLARFVALWALLAVPAGLIIHHYIGSFLPNTYLGKIMSSAPRVLNRGWLERTVWGVLSLGDGWVRIAWPLHYLAPVLAAGLVFVMIDSLLGLRKPQRAAGPVFGLVVLCGYLFLPFAYGFSFPIHPAFGGYYNRYIAPVYALWVIMGMIGIHSFFCAAAQRYPAMAKYRRLLAPGLAALLIIYQGGLWSFQVKNERAVFAREVKLNTGLRMEAARWLANPENVPPKARVMVGYTGLGVVGGMSNHYVLDLGALINPDIFKYYRDAPKNPQGRWARIVRYMHDRGITYYVTFAFPRGYADRIADPARTPGFEEAARLGSRGEPAGPYEQIRIYRIDWREWEKQNQG